MSFNEVYDFATKKQITVKLCGNGAMTEMQAKSLIENSINVSDKDFNAIVCVNCPRDEELCAFNDAKEKKLPFFLLNAKGCQGRIFVWYPISTARQPSILESALPKLCNSILLGNPTIVTYHKDFKLDVNVGDSVRFEQSKGTTSINGKKATIAAIDSDQFFVKVDTTKDCGYRGDALCEESRVARFCTFKELQASLQNPKIGMSILSSEEKRTAIDLHREWEAADPKYDETSPPFMRTLLSAVLTTELLKLQGVGVPCLQWAYISLPTEHVETLPQVLLHGAGPEAKEVAKLIYGQTPKVIIADGRNVEQCDVAFGTNKKEQLGKNRAAALAAELGEKAESIPNFAYDLTPSKLKGVGCVINTARMIPTAIKTDVNIVENIANLSSADDVPIIDLGFDGVLFHVDSSDPKCNPKLSQLRDLMPFCLKDYKLCTDEHYGTIVWKLKMVFDEEWMKIIKLLKKLLSLQENEVHTFIENNFPNEVDSYFKVFKRLLFYPKNEKELFEMALLKFMVLYGTKMKAPEGKSYIYPAHRPHQLCELLSLLSTEEEKEKALQYIKQCITNLAIIFQKALNENIVDSDWAEKIYNEKFNGLNLETLIEKIYSEKERIVTARNSLTNEYYDYYTKVIKQGKETVRDTKDVFIPLFEKLLEQKRQAHLNVYPNLIGVGPTTIQKAFLAAAAALRGMLFRIPLPPMDTVWMVAIGSVKTLKTIPKITAALAVHELYQLCANKQRTCFFANMFEPIIVSSAPVLHATPYIDINGDLTVEELSDFLTEKYPEATLDSIFLKNATIYRDTKSFKDRWRKKISEISKPESGSDFFILDCFIYDKNDEDIDIPQVRLFFNKK